MCDHEKTLDSGEYVYIKCGIVLGQEYIYEVNSFNDQIEKKDLGAYSSICNILEHLRWNTLCYAGEINDLIDTYLSNLKCKRELKVGACTYYLISSSGLACQLNRISGIICAVINDSEKLFYWIQIFPQQNNISTDNSILLEILLSYENYEKIEKCKISLLKNTLACKYCSS